MRTRPAAESALARLVEQVASSANPDGALARVQAAVLAQALGTSELGEAQRRAVRHGPQAAAVLEELQGSALGLAPVLRDPDALSRFYELLQARLQPEQRRALGQYFTPRPIVSAMWSLALDALASLGISCKALRVVDPAAGSGAFLVEALGRGLQGRQLLGVEILASAARTAAVNAVLAGSARTGRAPQILEGDAYAEESFEAMSEHLRGGAGTLVVGNPPYNGSSPLLRQPTRLASARARLLPFAGYHAPHSGFRDDFAYFFGLAHALLQSTDRPGVICFITPASLLDARDYLGLRRFLAERYAIQVIELGEGAFPDARIATCITVLTARGKGVRHLDIATTRDDALPALSEQPALAAMGTALTPTHPDYPLRPLPDIAPLEEDCDPLTEVLGRWFTPHKTGFDELLVDPDPELLRQRLAALRTLTPAAFAARFGPSFATPRVQEKLRRAREWAVSQPSFPEPDRLLPYLRYNPRRARFAAPAEQWQVHYFEPRIAQLFNHAFKGTLGSFRPHDQKPQLLFNTFEAPLYAMVVTRPGVLHLYQHARFAPLHLPEAILQGGNGRGPLGKRALNLTPAWAERAQQLRTPEDLFHLVAGIVNSALVQQLFAPAFGKRRVLPIKRQGKATFPIAQRIADRARLMAGLETRGDATHTLQSALDADVLRLYLGADFPDGALRRHPLAQTIAAQTPLSRQG
jgi:16S rRNA G966 N2-methylase RsmD